MGGRLVIDVTIANPEGTDRAGAVASADAGRRRGAAVGRRIASWAARLTRFAASSDLSRMNADPSATVAVRPTLAAVLHWAASAGERTGGIVDVTRLDERLAAELGDAPGNDPVVEARAWDVTPGRRGGVVRKPASGRFDLDGVAKGWLADRALALLADVPGAIVDADGDIAIRVAAGDIVEIGVADPRTSDAFLACLRLGPQPARATYGIATSGVTVHRWGTGRTAHHLIDPRTRRPAATDVVQATVLAATAREAEVLAKAAVILGRDLGLSFLAETRVLAAVVLTDAGECVATPDSIRWLAAA